ncbi:UDP-glucuronic acid decarboxylase family protein [Zwartia panacis]|uniref:UDP-glucuronic acid decarboxylase family protein n=1 Tax=Zwartia panacis TaxID=2683345 RepID=UPI0025B4EC80|nr:UDP-glucuronic acid decarboxylase family protein [Zwartia panacis]MDN4018050.1 SDR family oxidoreductase [Zwartia panacis]
MKKILVTGGAGFLGSHLCDRLIEQGHEIICLDSLFTGSQKNIESLLKHPSFTFIKHDVVDPIDFEKLDEIYNLACPASPVHYQFNPIHTMKTSVMGGLNMLELARKTGAKVFQASTSEVYGDPSVHPQPEEYWGNVNTIGIRSCYDEGKRAAETLFFDYQRVHGVKIKVVRIFNTYGPRMAADDGRVVSNFIVQALRGQDLTVYGDGSQTRSFCYADDLVAGFMQLMNAGDEIVGPINMGNPGEFTMIELAEKVLRLTGSTSKLIHMPLPQDDPKQRRPDITKAKQLLGWEPTVALEQGLERTIDYFKKVVTQ